MGSREGNQQANADHRATDKDMAADFLHWVSISRQIIADHFPSERAEPHNAMVVETARSLMLAHRLGQIETTLEGIQQALESSKES